MGFLEDLKNGDIKSIIIVIICILLFHQYWCISNMKENNIKEPMADLSADIKEAVKQVYLADVQAIRNLSEVANKLQAGSLTIPGNLTVTGNLSCLNDINTKTLNIKGKHGTTHFNFADKGETWLRDDVYVHDHLATKNLTAEKSRLGKFNIHNNIIGAGAGYLRFDDDNHIRHYGNDGSHNQTFATNNLWAGQNLLVNNNTYTKTLDIKGKHGTTHFNYADKGETYLRDDVNIAGHLTGTNFTMNTGGGKNIKTYPNSGQFVANNYVYFGEGAGGDNCAGKFCGVSR